ncbi:MAG TPA: OBAP family protein [Lysobacter sp.]|nr:OBAP family protein [Lysobacter sp.]
MRALLVRAGLLALLGSAAACSGSGSSPPDTTPAGTPETPRTNALEAGAALLQNDGPLAKLDVVLVGFHPLKDAPLHQMEAHHYCRQVNQDFAQCVLFDGNTEDANLNGIEYIISERLFATLPAEERAYWHPHNGEILSGQLIAPNLPRAAEHALMRDKINSYGKTWHTWLTRHDEHVGTPLPLGPARLAWSFNREGELDPSMLAERDRRFRMDSAERARARADLRSLARPQAGVDALHGRFPRPTRPIPGVRDAAGTAPAR